MEIILNLQVFIDWEIKGISHEQAREEFNSNWCHQVPHWKYLSYEGVLFFKELKEMTCEQEKLWLFQQNYKGGRV